MRRTAGRPLPSGRLTPAEAAAFGIGPRRSSGLAILALGVNPVAAGGGAGDVRPLRRSSTRRLKPMTTLNTAVGAVPGALPPVIGWAAATGRLGVEAWALFLIVFLWQFPHFLAIAWIYREDYARAGHRMLPTVDPPGAITGRQAAGLRPGAGPGGAPAGGRRPGRPVLLRRGAGPGPVLPGVARSGSGRNVSDADRPAAARGRRSCTCPPILLLLLLNPLPA